MLETARQRITAQENTARLQTEHVQLSETHDRTKSELETVKHQLSELIQRSNSCGTTVTNRYRGLEQEFNDVRARLSAMHDRLVTMNTDFESAMEARDATIEHLEGELKDTENELTIQKASVEQAVERAAAANEAVAKWKAIDAERQRDIGRAQAQLHTEESVTGSLRQELSVVMSTAGSEGQGSDLDTSSRTDPPVLLSPIGSAHVDGFVAESGQIGGLHLSASAMSSPERDPPLTARALRDAGLAPSPMQRSGSMMSGTSNWSTSSIGRLERLRSPVGALHQVAVKSPPMKTRTGAGSRRAAGTALKRRDT